MKPIAISRWWGGPDWNRLGAVLGRTLELFCPTWIRDLREVRGYSAAGKVQGNAWKLEEWVRAVSVYPDGARILLMDADAMVCQDLDPLWSKPFDVAFTLRPMGARFPMNAGIVALRLSEKTRSFLMRWHERNLEMTRDPALFRQFRADLGGVNQSALGSLEDSAWEDLRISWLPCAEWNCEDSTWSTAGPRTRIVHIKDGLRRCALGFPGRYTPDEQRLAAAWRRIEGEVEHGPQSLSRRAQAGR